MKKCYYRHVGEISLIIAILTLITSLVGTGQNSEVSTPPQVLSPVEGPIKEVFDLGDCPKDGAQPGAWCFNQHKTGDKGIGHLVGGGIKQADDTYAWDVNLNTPKHDSDNDKPVYAVAQGTVSQSYGGYTDGKYGNVLIEHSYQGNTWWSGYLHLTDIQVKKGQSVNENTVIGKISHVKADNNHLHFVVYTGKNSPGMLKSFDAQIASRKGNAAAVRMPTVGDKVFIATRSSVAVYMQVQGEITDIGNGLICLKATKGSDDSIYDICVGTDTIASITRV